MTDSIVPAEHRPDTRTHRPRKTAAHERVAVFGIIAVIATVLGVAGYHRFNGPNVTVQKGDNLVTIMGGDYPKAIRYADQFGLRIVETPLGGMRRSIDARTALATDTDWNRVTVHICPGDVVDAQFRWSYVKAANSACHRGTR